MVKTCCFYTSLKTPPGMARGFRARLRCGPPCPADSHSVLTLAGPETGSVLLCAYTLPASSAAHASLSGVSCQLFPANPPPSAPPPVWAAAQPPSRSPLQAVSSRFYERCGGQTGPPVCLASSRCPGRPSSTLRESHTQLPASVGKIQAFVPLLDVALA